MCRRPVGRMPLKTRLFFPSAPVANSRLLTLVAFVSFLHLCVKSFLEALHELESLDCLFARKFNRSLIKHRQHSLAPVRARVIQPRVDRAPIAVGITHWLNHGLQGYFGGFQ